MAFWSENLAHKEKSGIRGQGDTVCPVEYPYGAFSDEEVLQIHARSASGAADPTRHDKASVFILRRLLIRHLKRGDTIYQNPSCVDWLTEY